MATNVDEQSAKIDESELPFKDRMKLRFQRLLVSLRYFIYNPENNKIFGNTSSSWIKIATYYAIFYICLGLFYCGMIAVFGAILSRQSPRYTYRNNDMRIDGRAPIGMGFRPMTDIESTTIRVYNDTISQNATISSLRNYRIMFLTQYDTTYLQDCSPTEPASELQGSRSCRFSWSDIVTSETHPCSDSNAYGWAAGQPCVLVKLNKIYAWTPESGSVISQVENMTGEEVLSVDRREENIYITCNGIDASDRQYIGNMSYYSLLHPLGHSAYGGIPYYFFPYLNSREHVQPFVLVQFKSLPNDRSVNVECRAWAPNIEQLTQGTTLRGMTKFTLYK